MKHDVQIVEESIQRTGVDGLAFTTRCCNDPATDIPHHIQHAGTLTATELEVLIETEYLDQHAAQHEKGLNIEKILRDKAKLGTMKKQVKL